MATVQMSVRPEDLSQVPKGNERIPDPGIVVIFGASGDLTKRKLLPALFHLRQNNLLPKNFAIVGVARRPLGNEFAADMREGIVSFGGVDASDPKLDDFVGHISYFPLKFDAPEDYAGLKAELDRIAVEKGIGGDRLFYLATSPEFFSGIVENLGAQGDRRVTKGDDRRAVLGVKGDVGFAKAVATVEGPEPERGARRNSEADDVAEFHEPPGAQWSEHGVVEARGRGHVGALDGQVVDHRSSLPARRVQRRVGITKHRSPNSPMA